MKTNTDVTIYNKYFDDRDEKYQRTQIRDVEWENRKAANVLATGGDLAADAARIFIPLLRGTNYLKPRAWQALTTKTGKWTLQMGDVIVKGLVSDEITDGEPLFTLSDLKRKYDDVLIISSVDTMDMGSLSLQHWQLGAK